MPYHVLTMTHMSVWRFFLEDKDTTIASSNPQKREPSLITSYYVSSNAFFSYLVGGATKIHIDL